MVSELRYQSANSAIATSNAGQQENFLAEPEFYIWQ
jgi:hypothetical protein